MELKRDPITGNQYIEAPYTFHDKVGDFRGHIFSLGEKISDENTASDFFAFSSIILNLHVLKQSLKVDNFVVPYQIRKDLAFILVRNRNNPQFKAAVEGIQNAEVDLYEESILPTYLSFPRDQRT